jgi:hypothetical protein
MFRILLIVGLESGSLHSPVPFPAPTRSLEDGGAGADMPLPVVRLLRSWTLLGLRLRIRQAHSRTRLTFFVEGGRDLIVVECAKDFET